MISGNVILAAMLLYARSAYVVVSQVINDGNVIKTSDFIMLTGFSWQNLELNVTCNDSVSLVISRNTLSGVEPGAFAGWRCDRDRKLSAFKFSNNSNSMDQIFFNANFEQLIFSEMHITNNSKIIIGPDLKFDQNTEQIKLNDNDLTDVRANLFRNLKALKLLHLSGNRLKCLDENIFLDLNSLEELRLDSNKIEYLSRNIFLGTLETIKIIELQNNQLKWLSSNHFKFRKDGNGIFPKIDAENNPMTYLPKCLAQLANFNYTNTTNLTLTGDEQLTNTAPEDICKDIDDYDYPAIQCEGQITTNSDDQMATNSDDQMAPNSDDQMAPNSDDQMAPNIDDKMTINSDDQMATNSDDQMENKPAIQHDDQMTTNSLTEEAIEAYNITSTETNHEAMENSSLFAEMTSNEVHLPLLNPQPTRKPGVFFWVGVSLFPILIVAFLALGMKTIREKKYSEQAKRDHDLQKSRRKHETDIGNTPSADRLSPERAHRPALSGKGVKSRVAFHAEDTTKGHGGHNKRHDHNNATSDGRTKANMTSEQAKASLKIKQTKASLKNKHDGESLKTAHTKPSVKIKHARYDDNSDKSLKIRHSASRKVVVKNSSKKNEGFKHHVHSSPTKSLGKLKKP